MTGALLLAFAQVSAPGPENWAYITCATSSISDFLKGSPSRAEFERHIRSACPREQAALRRLIVSRQLKGGRSASQAVSDADEFFETLRVQMRDLQPISAR